MRGLLLSLLVAWPACALAQAGVDILVLGEVHDNPAHHREQARILAGIRPRALVFEMLAPEAAERAAGIDRADAPALEAALGWNASGWPDFALYHPLFRAAPEAAILGAAVPRDDLRRAMREGAAAAFGPGAAAFGLGPLAPADQAAREAEQAAAHCGALPADLLPGLVEAQRLRDAAMAAAALRALETFGGPVAVIAGTGHARTDTGVPAAIRAARPAVRVWALGQTEGDPGPGAPFDAVNVTAPVPRGDPCAAFAGPGG
jgi:uncharacterized iron-regulated protein